VSTETDKLTLLVPVDFSEESRRALAWAFDYAQRAPCDVHLMHVFEQRVAAADFSSGHEAVDDEIADVERAAREELDQMAPSEAERQAVGHISRHFTNGSPAEEIVNTAGSIGADLIVVGTHGRTGFRRAVIGSVAERVVRNAPCTVVCVKQTTSNG